MPVYEFLQFQIKDEIGYLTINRPKAMNALNAELLQELKNFAEMNAQPEFRVLVITGAGEKAFVAGADIKAMQTMSPEDALRFARAGQEAFSALERISCPVIAAVNGFALGGGFELALACDVIFAAENAKFGLPEVTLGLLPAFGGTQRLSRSLGLFRAREFIFSGNFITSEELKALGVVSKICPLSSLLSEVETLAKRIAAQGPLAIAGAKRAINEGFDLPLAQGLDLEAKAFGKLFSSADQREGTAAFVEKRKPNFVGA